MSNILAYLAQIILVIVTLSSLTFGLYLRRRLYLQQQKAKAIQIFVSYELDLEKGTEQVIYNPQLLYTPKKSGNKPHVTRHGFDYAFEETYSQLHACA